MMKTPAEILRKTENGLPQPSWISKTPTGSPQSAEPASHRAADPISVQTKALVNMIFARFMAIYGHKFKSCFETENELRIAKREWALSLGAYHESQLVAAVDQCKVTLAWMPSISEFLGILEKLGAGDGIPSVRQAYQEAARFADSPTKHNWSHPVVYHAGRETEWFRLRSEEERVIYPIFAYNYDAVVRRFRQGEQLDHPVPKALEDKQELSLFAFIQHWAKQQTLSEELASSLLYYLTKPEGSKARALYRKKSEEKLKSLELSIKLPDTIGPVC
jgi:hypothetical protein